MNMKRLTFLLILAASFVLAGAARSAESGITKKFVEALEAQNETLMSSIIEENREKIPGEIGSLLEDAGKAGTAAADREAKFYIAERMANTYKNVTGNTEILKNVKQKTFESKLSPPVNSAPEKGVHTVEIIYREPVKNVFSPDNIIIKSGDNVRWVNNDKEAHILASVPFIGLGGVLSPRVEAGERWEHKFDKPGEYYYICFIHKVMYGKITVEK